MPSSIDTSMSSPPPPTVKSAWRSPRTRRSATPPPDRRRTAATGRARRARDRRSRRPRLQRELRGGATRHGPSSPNGVIGGDDEIRVRALEPRRRPRISTAATREPSDHTTASASASSTRRGARGRRRPRRRRPRCAWNLRGRRRAPPSSPGARPRRMPTTAQRVAVGILDLHDVGAAVGEQLRGVRARDAARQIDDEVSGQRLHRLSRSFCGSTYSTGSPADTCCRCR